MFYKARENGQKFLGNAVIQEIVNREDDSVYYVEMNVVSVWSKPVEMRDVLDNLGFIKNKKSWGQPLSGRSN